MRILGFDWDETNRAKVELHDLDPESIEDLFECGAPWFLRHPTVRGRFLALGFVPDERFTLVVFDYDPTTRWVRVVTAYEPTSPKWWKEYEERAKAGR